MTLRRAALGVCGLAAACENTPDYALVFTDDAATLADRVRSGAVEAARADLAALGEDPALDVTTAKARATVYRGAGGRHVAAFRPYVPATPNGAEAAVASDELFTVAGGPAGPYARRHGPRERIVGVAPWRDGLLALVCDPQTGALVYGLGQATAVFVTPDADLDALGACDGPAAIGAATGGYVLAAGGAAHRVDEATGEVTPLGALDAADLVWLEERGGALERVTARGASFTWSDGTALATADLDGAPLGEPVWRALDGDLRLATTAGVWAWAPPAAPTRLGAPPEPGVDAPWAPVGAALLARETRPNDREPTLAVPVATEVAFATDDGFVAVALPVTPCADDAACRDFGESEVIAVAGTADHPAALYDVWTWARQEAHATWAAP